MKGFPLSGKPEAATHQALERVPVLDGAIGCIHLPSAQPAPPASPQIIREFEGHLRTVAAERDAALAQLEGAEAAREEAGRRLREAERQEVGCGMECSHEMPPGC